MEHKWYGYCKPPAMANCTRKKGLFYMCFNVRMFKWAGPIRKVHFYNHGLSTRAEVPGKLVIPNQMWNFLNNVLLTRNLGCGITCPMILRTAVLLIPLNLYKTDFLITSVEIVSYCTCIMLLCIFNWVPR